MHRRGISAGLRQRGACSISKARGPKLKKTSQHLLNHKVCGQGKRVSIALLSACSLQFASWRDSL